MMELLLHHWHNVFFLVMCLFFNHKRIILLSSSLVLRYSIWMFMLIHECNDHIKGKKIDILFFFMTILWDLHGAQSIVFPLIYKKKKIILIIIMIKDELSTPSCRTWWSFPNESVHYVPFYAPSISFLFLGLLTLALSTPPASFLAPPTVWFIHLLYILPSRELKSREKVLLVLVTWKFSEHLTYFTRFEMI